MHDLTFWETTDFIPVNSAAKLVSDILESQLIHRKKNAEYAKKFFEEIAPITHLANHLKCTSIRFTNDAIEEIARLSEAINERTEDIGARRLHTVMENLLEDISFNASGDHPVIEVVIDKKYVDDHLEAIVRSQNLKKYIL